MKNEGGIPKAAPYGLRKVEAILLKNGFDVTVADPDHLGWYLEDADVLAITVMDPFGWGPASSTFTSIINRGEVFSSIFFRKLLTSEEVRGAKRRGAKIIVGGPGTWEFAHAPESLDRYGIDCVIGGEVELELASIIDRLLRGEDLPKIIDVQSVPELEDIPEIVAPSVNGLVEVGRGCPRGCKFCEVALRKLRWYPLSKIEKEILANTRGGQLAGIIHAEDVPLYGVDGVRPEIDKLIPLFELFAKHYNNISWSHASIAAISACPESVERASEIFLEGRGQRWFGAEVGIETGSSRLIEKAMPAKPKPFKAEEWPEIVKNSMGIMHDNSLVPACTLITGLPQETEDDVIQTIELLDDIKGYRAMVVPLFFVPMGRLKDRDWFSREQLSGPQEELLKKCLANGIYWGKDLARGYNRGHLYSPIVNRALLTFVDLLELIGKRKKLVQ
jgi:radical SAM superfamily enzyme YgiQ (UPF0313 family)